MSELCRTCPEMSWTFEEMSCVCSDPAQAQKEELDKLKSGEALQSALHTVSAAKYYRERPLNEGKTVEDRSFVLIWEKEPVIAFQGALVSNNTTKNLLFLLIFSKQQKLLN